MKEHETILNSDFNMETYENRIPMHLWAEDDIPWQKLLLKGSYSLSDSELLSIIIDSGRKGEDPLDQARTILSRCGNSLCEFWKLGITDIEQASGLNNKIIVRIMAMFDLARRRNEAEVLYKEKMASSRDAFVIFSSIFGDLPHEEFWILVLNKANKVVKKVRISEGGISGTVVDPKKIFQICLACHATSIILGHNHPSGNTQPSDADRKITKKIKDCGILLDIAVLDHIIVGDGRYYSFADEGSL